MKRLFMALALSLISLSANANNIGNQCGPFRVPVIVVGDGHGSALVSASNWCWQNLTKIGRSIFDPSIENQLRSLPSGSPVVISLGMSDKDFGKRKNWKEFHIAVMRIQMIADQQKLRWFWIMPPCLPDQSTDWVREQIESELDISETWDWPYCQTHSPMPRSDVFYTSQILNIETEFLRRFNN